MARDNVKLFSESVDVLKEAYFDDILEHWSCTACLVGNLIANRLDLKIARDNEWMTMKTDYEPFILPIHLPKYYWISENGETVKAQWNHVFNSDMLDVQHRHPEYYRGEAKRQLDATGFTWQELAEMEFAFESTKKLKTDTDDDYMFNGLMRGIEKMADILNIDLNAKEQAKRPFAMKHKSRKELRNQP